MASGVFGLDVALGLLHRAWGFSGVSNPEFAECSAVCVGILVLVGVFGHALTAAAPNRTGDAGGDGVEDGDTGGDGIEITPDDCRDNEHGRRHEVCFSKSPWLLPDEIGRAHV